tara:strand:+ start:692 stop:811 length:120 start_codon:yes stop_codon:yes gene_type:complete
MISCFFEKIAHQSGIWKKAYQAKVMIQTKVVFTGLQKGL